MLYSIYDMLIGDHRGMENSQDLGWIVDALIDLNTYCEREGLVGISEHLIQAIESIAPAVRNLPVSGSP